MTTLQHKIQAARALAQQSSGQFDLENFQTTGLELGGLAEFLTAKDGETFDFESAQQYMTLVSENGDLNEQQQLAALTAESFVQGIIAGNGVSDSFMSFDADSQDGQMTLSGLPGQIPEAAFEAFTAAGANKYREMTIGFNVKAAVQSDWAEAFYPTEIIAPDNYGYIMELPTDEMYIKNKHDSVTGKGIETRRLIEAAYDSSMLMDNAIALHQISSAENDAVLSNVAGGTETKSVFGVNVTTKPVKVGVEFDMIALTQHEALVGKEIMDHSDDLSRNFGFRDVFVNISTGADATLETRAVKLNLEKLADASFVPTPTGDPDELTGALDHVFVLDASTVTATGANLGTELGLTFGDKKLAIRVNLTSKVNVAYGGVQPVLANAKVEYVEDAAGDRLVGDSLETSLTGLVADSVNFYGSRTNTNTRSGGIEMRTIKTRHPLPVGLCAPLRQISEAGKSNTAENLASLAKLNAQATDAAAIRQLTSWYAHVKPVSGQQTGISSKSHGAAANYLIPAAVDVEVDLALFITNDQSNRRAGAQTSVVGAVETAVAKLMRTSRIMSAYRGLIGGGVKPTIIAVTTPDVCSLIKVDGEDKPFDLDLEKFSVDYSELTPSTTPDSAYIYVALTNKEAGVNPLKFGNLFQMPSIVSDRPTSRGNRTVNEMIVTPRYQHHNHVPVIARILVKNVSKAYTSVTA